MGDVVRMTSRGPFALGAIRHRGAASVVFEPDPDLLHRTGCDSPRMSRQQLEDICDKLSAENRRLKRQRERLGRKLKNAENVLAKLKARGRKDVTQRRK